MMRTKLLTVGSAALIVTAALAATPAQSNTRVLKKAPAAQLVIKKWCGQNFSKTAASTQGYTCSMTIEHYCPSGYIKEALQVNGNQLQYRCIEPPA